MTTISQKAYAKHRGVHPTTVMVWRRKGRIATNSSGQILKEKSDAMLAARPEVYRGGVIGGTPKAGGGSKTHSRRAEAMRIKEYYLAQTAQLNFEKAAAQYCRAEDMLPAIETDHALIRRHCSKLGAHVAVRLAANPAVAHVAEQAKVLIDAEVAKTLSEQLVATETFERIKQASGNGEAD